MAKGDQEKKEEEEENNKKGKSGKKDKKSKKSEKKSKKSEKKENGKEKKLNKSKKSEKKSKKSEKKEKKEKGKGQKSKKSKKSEKESKKGDKEKSKKGKSKKEGEKSLSSLAKSKSQKKSKKEGEKSKGKGTKEKTKGKSEKKEKTKGKSEKKGKSKKSEKKEQRKSEKKEKTKGKREKKGKSEKKEKGGKSDKKEKTKGKSEKKKAKSEKKEKSKKSKKSEVETKSGASKKGEEKGPSKKGAKISSERQKSAVEKSKVKTSTKEDTKDAKQKGTQNVKIPSSKEVDNKSVETATPQDEPKPEMEAPPETKPLPSAPTESMPDVPVSQEAKKEPSTKEAPLAAESAKPVVSALEEKVAATPVKIVEKAPKVPEKPVQAPIPVVSPEKVFAKAPEKMAPKPVSPMASAKVAIIPGKTTSPAVPVASAAPHPSPVALENFVSQKSIASPVAAVKATPIPATAKVQSSTSPFVSASKEQSDNNDQDIEYFVFGRLELKFEGSDDEKTGKDDQNKTNSHEQTGSPSEEADTSPVSDSYFDPAHSRNCKIPGVKCLRPNASILAAEFLQKLDKDVNSELSKCLHNVDKWDFDVFQLFSVSNGRPLVSVAFSLLKRRNFINTFDIDPTALITYFLHLEDHYDTVQYHNSMHAADVAQSVHVLLLAKLLTDVFDELEIFAILFAACIHDVHHPGQNNDYLIKAGSELAVLYADQSVLEHHHLAVAFRLMQESKCNFLKHWPKADFKAFRKIVVDLVLATDMEQHKFLLSDLKDFVRNREYSDNGSIDLDDPVSRRKVLQIIIHLADLSSSTKPLKLCKEWGRRITEEFFIQGDLEKQKGFEITPMFNRLITCPNKSQVGFFEFVAIPLWKTWTEFVFPDAQEMMKNLNANKAWFLSESQKTPPVARPAKVPIAPKSAQVATTKPVQPSPTMQQPAKVAVTSPSAKAATKPVPEKLADSPLPSAVPAKALAIPAKEVTKPVPSIVPAPSAPVIPAIPAAPDAVIGKKPPSSKEAAKSGEEGNEEDKSSEDDDDEDEAEDEDEDGGEGEEGEEDGDDDDEDDDDTDTQPDDADDEVEGVPSKESKVAN